MAGAVSVWAKPTGGQKPFGPTVVHRMFGASSGGVAPTPTRGDSRGRGQDGFVGAEVVPEAWRGTDCGCDTAGDETGTGARAGLRTGAAGAGLAGW